MTIKRRLTAVLLQAALVLLPLSSARAHCTGEHTAPAGMADMPGMTIPDGADATQHECLADPDQQCENMLVCANVVMSNESLTDAAALRPSANHLFLLARDPLWTSRAPEPPPPRA